MHTIARELAQIVLENNISVSKSNEKLSKQSILTEGDLSEGIP